MSKKVKALLIISLAINLLVVGMFAGRHFGFMKGHRHLYGPYGHILYMAPTEKRDQIKAVLERNKMDFTRHRGRHRRNWATFSEILKQDTFDKAKFMDAFEKEVAKRGERWRKHADLIIEIAEILSPQERKAMVERMEKRFKHRHRFRNYFRGGKPPTDANTPKPQ